MTNYQMLRNISKLSSEILYRKNNTQDINNVKKRNLYSLILRKINYLQDLILEIDKIEKTQELDKYGRTL